MSLCIARFALVYSFIKDIVWILYSVGEFSKYYFELYLSSYKIQMLNWEVIYGNKVEIGIFFFVVLEMPKQAPHPVHFKS